MANLSSWRCLLKKLLKTGEEKIPNLAERGEPGGSHRDTDTPPPPHDELHLYSSRNTTISHGTLLRQNKSV